jgi:hypothetical protein
MIIHRMCIRAYIYLYVRIYIYTCVYISIRAYIYLYERIYISTFVYVSIRTNVCACPRTPAYTRARRPRAHTHTHATQTLSLALSLSLPLMRSLHVRTYAEHKRRQGENGQADATHDGPRPLDPPHAHPRPPVKKTKKNSAEKKNKADATHQHIRMMGRRRRR